MKHLLNNLTESEKKEILSKYDGNLRVNVDKFTKLVESRLGDVKLHESSAGQLHKVYTTPKDLYKYALINCKWHAISGPQNRLKKWTQVPESGEKELDMRFPNAKKESMCGVEDVCLGLKKTGLYTKEGKYFIEYHTDGFCYMNKEGVPVPTESLKNKEGTVTGKWTCTNNKVKCTPI